MCSHRATGGIGLVLSLVIAAQFCAALAFSPGIVRNPAPVLESGSLILPADAGN
jgi:hypothetical protein